MIKKLIRPEDIRQRKTDESVAKILSLLAENTGGVSNDSAESSGLHVDRERDASRSSGTHAPESFVGGSIV